MADGPNAGNPARKSEDRWGPRNTAAVAIAASLRFDAVSRRFAENLAVDNVSLQIVPGEIVCLLGPSGSGKTTLMRIAAGIERPDTGSVWIDDRVVSGDGVEIPPEKRGVGLVFQDHALFPHLTILQNVRFGLQKFTRSAARDTAMRMLERVGMNRYADRYPHQLSGGEQQRVALARALAPRPGILLLDEPFSGLDSRLRDTIRDETIALLRDTRSTAIIVTHDPEEALRVGDRIALMRAGRLVQFGTGEELYRRPVDLFAARFFSELNRFPTMVVNGQVNTPLGTFAAAGHSEGSQVEACFRLADISVFSGHGEGPGGIAGRIGWRRFVGTSELLEIHVQGADDPVRARLPAGSLAANAVDVSVQARQAQLLLFATG